MMLYKTKKTKQKHGICPKCKKVSSSFYLYGGSFSSELSAYFDDYNDTGVNFKDMCLDLKKYEGIDLTKELKKLDKPVKNDKFTLGFDEDDKRRKKAEKIFKHMLDKSITICEHCNAKFTFEGYEKKTKLLPVLEVTCLKCKYSWLEKLDYDSCRTQCVNCNEFLHPDFQILNESNLFKSCKDHVDYDEKTRVLTFQPYNPTPGDMKRLIEYCEKTKCLLDISGHSDHYKDCFTLSMTSEDAIKCLKTLRVIET